MTRPCASAHGDLWDTTMFLFVCLFLGIGCSLVNTCRCRFLGWWLQLVSLLVDGSVAGRTPTAIATGDWSGQLDLTAFGVWGHILNHYLPINKHFFFFLLARVPGPWVYLPGVLFIKGTNQRRTPTSDHT